MTLKRSSSFVLTVFLVLVLAPPAWSKAKALPQQRYEVLPAHDVAVSPDDLDVMPVMKHWMAGKKKSPKVVMVLVPGFFGGIQNFAYAGQRLVERYPRMQVWVVERRNNLLENRCGMELAQKEGYGRTQTISLYYLEGAVALNSGCPQAADEADPMVWDGNANEQALSQDEAAEVGMAEWGLETELEDIRAVVQAAHKEYPKAKVVLGGHSLGGMTTQLYAGWRFGSKPSSAGWKTIDGMVLIDGAVSGPTWADTMVPQSFATRAMTDAGDLYWDDFAGGRTSLLGLLAELGALAAIQEPDVESYIWRALQPPLTWPFDDTCPTNRAAFAGLTDDQYGFSPTFRASSRRCLGTSAGPGRGNEEVCGPRGRSRVGRMARFRR